MSQVRCSWDRFCGVIYIYKLGWFFFRSSIMVGQEVFMFLFVVEQGREIGVDERVILFLISIFWVFDLFYSIRREGFINFWILQFYFVGREMGQGVRDGVEGL